MDIYTDVFYYWKFGCYCTLPQAGSVKKMAGINTPVLIILMADKNIFIVFLLD
jgi:hypothetical protein